MVTLINRKSWMLLALERLVIGHGLKTQFKETQNTLGQASDICAGCGHGFLLGDKNTDK